MKFCIYYQAKIQKELCWIVTATLKYSEHVAFDRCYNKEQSIFEFFVTPDLQDVFLSIMHVFEKHHIVSELQCLPNRLLDEKELV